MILQPHHQISEQRGSHAVSKYIYVIGNEILSPIVESQVYRPLANRARREQAEALMVAILPVGYFIRSALRQKLKERQMSFSERYGIRTRVIVGGTSRIQSRTLQTLALRRCFRQELGLGGNHVVFGRNSASTCVVLDALKGHPENVSTVFDCRGDEPYEHIGAQGADWEQADWSDTLRRAFIEKMCLQQRACDAGSIIVVSETMGKVLFERHKAPKSKMVIKPCAVDMGVFPEPDRAAARKRLGIHEQFVVCYLGSLAWYQLPDQAIRLFKLIKSHRPAALFLGITTEPERLGGMLQAAGLQSGDFRVISVSSREVPDYLPAADLGLLLRERNPVNAVAAPVKFAEYLACKVPVLITPEVGDYSTLVEEKRLGGVVDIADNDANLLPVVESILTIIENDPDCRKRARSHVADHLNLEVTS